MGDEREIVTESISDQELERRWKEVRKRMEEEKIDFLVMQNDNEWLGGYVKWFTDVPARNAQAHTIHFSRGRGDDDYHPRRQTSRRHGTASMDPPGGEAKAHSALLQERSLHQHL